MARVLFYTGILMLGISAALIYLPTCFSYVIVALLLIFIIVSALFSKRFALKGVIIMLIISLLFTLYGISVVENKLSKAENLANKTYEITGTIMEFPKYYDDYTVYEIKTQAIKPIEDNKIKENIDIKNIKIRITDVNNYDFEIFDKISIKAELNSLGEYRNGNISNNIFASGYLEELIARRGKNRPFYAIFYDFREYLNGLMYDNMNYDDATFLSTLLIGDDSRLDSKLYENAKLTGVSHVLVVSGMHLGIIFQIIMYLCSFLRLNKRLTATFLIFSVFAVSAICGFTPSVLRAGLTYLLIAVGMFILRKPDALNSLGFAVVIILFFLPFGFTNVSLMLSLCSTFGLLFLCPVLFRLCKRVLIWAKCDNAFFKGLSLSLCQTLSAIFCTMPISICYFGYTSLSAPITNVLIGYASTAMLGIGILVLFLLSLPGVLKTMSVLPIFVLSILIKYTKFVINFFAKANNSIIVLGVEALYIWLICFIVGFGLILFKKCGKLNSRFLKTSVVLTLALVLSLCVSLSVFSNKNSASALKVAKGHCAVLCYNDTVVAIGAGDGKSDVKTINNYLLCQGQNKIDYLILPSLSKEVSGGAAALIRELEVKNVILGNEGEKLYSLNHIADNSFTYFSNKCSFEYNNISIYIYKDKGVNISVPECNFCFAIDENFYSVNKNSKNILITTTAVNCDLNDFEQVIISGSAENVLKIKQKINNKNNIYDCVDKNITFKIER